MRRNEQINFYDVEMGKDNPLYLFYREPEGSVGVPSRNTLAMFNTVTNSIGLFVSHFHPKQYHTEKTAAEALIDALIHENLHKALNPIVCEICDPEKNEKENSRLHETGVNLFGCCEDSICDICGNFLNGSKCPRCGFSTEAREKSECISVEYRENWWKAISTFQMRISQDLGFNNRGKNRRM